MSFGYDEKARETMQLQINKCWEFVQAVAEKLGCRIEFWVPESLPTGFSQAWVLIRDDVAFVVRRVLHGQVGYFGSDERERQVRFEAHDIQGGQTTNVVAPSRIANIARPPNTVAKEIERHLVSRSQLWIRMQRENSPGKKNIDINV